jgi:predicted CXXCH cytochrome family protein
MKKFRKLIKAIPAATVMLLLIGSQGAQAGTIFGSPHDFRGPPWKRSGEICLPCHVPHSTQTLPAPLWDLGLSSDTYIVYGMTRSPAANAKPSRQPDGLSKICLSCHDGIIASEVYGGHTGASAGDPGRGPMAGMPGNDHPISFVYDSALAMKDKDLYDPATRPSGMAGGTGTIDADLLFLKRMECASCHDVHNTKAVPGTKLLVKETAGSALCLTCHNK